MARPRIYTEDRVKLDLRLPRSMHDELKSYVDSVEGLSQNRLIETLIVEFLARQKATAIDVKRADTPTGSPIF